MKIKVLRDYSGAEGTDVDKSVHAGEVFSVSRARANELAANGLVEIVEEEEGDVPDNPEAKQAEKPENKKAVEPKNKSAPKAKSKAAAK
ncbi:hypothetical protein E3U23_11215 [Erythrobacter litoralis]|uniref:hypothetical protein n=1 Tax=Erythrobacter litoralis TaxID=39960 RepID=UPI002436077C|nr:hypothetical protein [Erythrobacter litoralis]MDG6079758.1 hypothetical protein [Erythrobacter litoralis]